MMGNRMNFWQRLVLLIYVIGLVAVILFPPWVKGQTRGGARAGGGEVVWSVSAGFHPLWRGTYSGHIDPAIWAVEILALTLVCVALLLFLQGQSKPITKS